MQCSFCHKKYETKSALNRHKTTTRFCLKIQLEMNQKIDKRMFECSFCNKELTSKPRLAYHIGICKIKKEQEKIAKDKIKQELLEKIQQERLIKEKIKQDLFEKTYQKKLENAAYKKKTIPKILKTHVWYTHVGKEIGMTKCLCCNRNEITQMDFDCGHIIAEKKGGPTTIENLLPICTRCNRSMRTMNMNEFKEKYFTPSKQSL